MNKFNVTPTLLPIKLTVPYFTTPIGNYNHVDDDDVVNLLKTFQKKVENILGILII